MARELTSEEGRQAVSVRLAEQYIQEFGRLASKTNTLIIPAQANDIACLLLFVPILWWCILIILFCAGVFFRARVSLTDPLCTVPFTPACVAVPTNVCASPGC